MIPSGAPVGAAATRAARARVALFGMGPAAADLRGRGFPEPPEGAAAAFELLQVHARTFIEGYDAMVAATGEADLARRFAAAPRGRLGFWVEGAAMGATVLDTLVPRPHRLGEGRAVGGGGHKYLVHVGVGWSPAKLRVLRPATRRELDPVLRWLALDGLGFARAFFAPDRHVVRAVPTVRRGGYPARIADQGVGRCLWFHAAADPRQLQQRLARFAPDRHADLWSGVGLAATYAGGASADDLAALLEASGEHRGHVGQGSVWGAVARVAVDDVLPGTVAACTALTGLDPEGARELAESTRAGAGGGTAADYEAWRERIRTAVPSGRPR